MLHDATGMASRPQPVCHDLCHTSGMASRTVRARLDGDSAAALRLLVNSGMPESEAVRTALIEAQSARLTDEALRAECARLMQDEKAVAREMAELREWEEISAPWPD